MFYLLNRHAATIMAVTIPTSRILRTRLPSSELIGAGSMIDNIAGNQVRRNTNQIIDAIIRSNSNHFMYSVLLKLPTRIGSSTRVTRNSN